MLAVHLETPSSLGLSGPLLGELGAVHVGLVGHVEFAGRPAASELASQVARRAVGSRPVRGAGSSVWRGEGLAATVDHKT